MSLKEFHKEQLLKFRSRFLFQVINWRLLTNYEKLYDFISDDQLPEETKKMNDLFEIPIEFYGGVKYYLNFSRQLWDSAIKDGNIMTTKIDITNPIYHSDPSRLNAAKVEWYYKTMDHNMGLLLSYVKEYCAQQYYLQWQGKV
jgi:hypothetical protein